MSAYVATIAVHIGYDRENIITVNHETSRAIIKATPITVASDYFSIAVEYSSEGNAFVD